jgi:hypothetical protein
MRFWKTMVLPAVLAAATAGVRAEQFVLAEGIGGPGSFVRVLDTAVDGMGNTCLVGYFHGNVDFDPGPGTYWLTSGGGFVLMLDAEGRFEWAAHFRSESSVYPTHVAVDPAGIVYVVGWFRSGTMGDTTDFDPGPGVVELYAPDDEAFFVKLYPGGSLIWVQRLRGEGVSYARAIALDGDQNLYILGTFDGLTDFDSGPNQLVLEPPGNGVDGYLLKLSHTGEALWVKHLIGDSQVWPNDLVVGAQQEISLVGNFRGRLDLDLGDGQDVVASAGGSDSFLIHLDAAGEFIAGARIGGTADDTLSTVDFDGHGMLYAAGVFGGTLRLGDAEPPLTAIGENDAFVTKFDPASGFVWARSLQGSSDVEPWRLSEVVRGLSVAGGVVHTVGTFLGTVDFDPGSGLAQLTSAGGRDVYVSELDTDGHYVWAGRLGGPADDMAASVTAGLDGRINVAGSFSATADFDPGPGNFELTSMGDDTFFVVLSTCVTELPDDGVDQDCDGSDAVTCFFDADGDGHGGLQTTVALDGTCDAGQHESLLGDDCDEADPSVHPGAVDRPGNSIDEDCDGTAVCDPATFVGNRGQLMRCVVQACSDLARADLLDGQECHNVFAGRRRP